MSEDIDDLTLVTRPARKILNERQLVDYREHRRDLLEWLLRIGKEPAKAEGYAFQTVDNRSYRMDQFYRWIWEQEGRYTTGVTHEHADDWVQELAYSDYSNAHKNNCLKALHMLFKWRHHELGEEMWEPEMRFQAEKSSPRDYLTKEERAKIREAALEYGSVPKPEGLSPRKRSKWKAYLAQRFEKPKSVALALDEFDQLQDKTEVAYDLHMLSQQTENKLGLVLISNLPPEELLLDSRSWSRLNCRTLEFESYSAAQLRAILENRVEQAFQPGTVDDDVLETIAREVAENGGDCRQAFERLLQAARRATQHGAREVTRQDLVSIDG